MIVGVLLALGTAIVAVLYLRKLSGWDEPRIDRADTRGAPWLQLASYADGRVTHLTPIRDGVHLEDERGECSCHPTSGGYRTNDDQAGVLYVHHLHDERLERAGR